MSDFPSLADLTNKNSGQSQPGRLRVSSSDVEEKFQKKMQQVSIKEKEQRAASLARDLGFPHIDLSSFPVSQQALSQVPKEEALAAKAVCFFYDSNEVRVGAVDPGNEVAQNLLTNLEERTHAKGGLYTISQHSFDKVIKMYERLPEIKPVTKDVSVKEEDLEKVQADVKDFSHLQELLSKTNTSDLVTFLLGAALKLDASDLHIEAEETGIHVRLRLDGILHDAATLEKNVFGKLISRVKLIAGLKINITTKPQDGRFTIKMSGGDVDVRVSTMPTYYGESIVMRLLPQKREGLTFDQIGLMGDAYNRLKKEIERPNGMIITTGPTGSGKTTTLYSIMQILNKPGVKVITLEDPVEYRMEGINQSQVDREKGYTFASGLKSILRQDPDIAMVGEIRDLETSEIAIQAALTGHLMMSTLHTNSAAAAVPRFLSMGVKPFLLAPALNAIIGQRLVRRLAPEHKVEATLTPEQEERVDKIIASMPENIRKEVEAKPKIFYTTSVDGPDGYKGRIGIYEILVVTPELEKMVLAGNISEYEIEKHAVENGMMTMVMDGVLKALEGITSLDEVFRIIE